MHKLQVLVSLLATFIAPCVFAAPDLRDGDIIQSSLSGQSAAIQRATHSPYSHAASSSWNRDELCKRRAVG